MKLLFLTLFALVFVQVQSGAQSLEVTSTGIEPVVISFDSLNASAIYTRAKQWINDTYSNPTKVIAVDEENETIRINAYKDNAYYAKVMGSVYYNAIDYTLEMQFRDGRMKVTYTPTRVYSETGNYNFNPSTWYKSNGEIRKLDESRKISLDETMDILLTDLVDAISKVDLNDDW